MWENIGFYNWAGNWVVRLQWAFATHGIYMALSAYGQVVIIVADTLCCIHYYIYNAIQMQLYATNFHVRFSCTPQHGEWNVNMDPFVDEWRMFTISLMNIIINHFIHPFDNWIMFLYFITYL